MQNVLFVTCALNELFFIALYLLAFSSPRVTPSLLQPEPSTLQAGSPAVPLKPSTLFSNPWSAGAMEMARYVHLTPAQYIQTDRPHH